MAGGFGPHVVVGLGDLGHLGDQGVNLRPLGPDPNTPTPGLGGPDLTPSKSVIQPTPLRIDLRPDSVINPGKAIAKGLLIAGLALVVLGFILWLSRDTYDLFDAEGMAAAVARGLAGLGMMPLGVIVAALGVHAFAVRPRS